MNQRTEAASATRREWMRRTALAGGAGALSALVGGPAAGQQTAPAEMPPWMRTPGGPDQAYGQPAASEASVLRSFPDEGAGFPTWHTPLAALRGTITPSGLHFAVHHNGVPTIDPGRHRLVVHGRVERPMQWDLERLLRYPMVSRMAFIECSGNSAANAMAPFAKDWDLQRLSGQVSCSEWTGVPVAWLLREAGVRPDASWAIAEGADAGSHQRSIPVAKLMDDAMIALFQNGERVRPSQGYPMRLLLPGWEGNAQVKWLHRLELTDQPAHSKDEAGLYTEVLADGRIERMSFTMEVKSVIVRPSGQQRLPAQHGLMEIEGLAWSGRGRITRVEVSVDGGRQWMDARLHGPSLPQSFVRFSVPWAWQGRPATLMSRAHDETGAVQPSRSTWKSRYAAHSFNHYNAVQAWAIGSDGRVENTYA